MGEDQTLNPKTGLRRDINQLFRDRALGKGMIAQEQVDRAEALRVECNEEIAPWLHHCLIAQDSLTEKEALDVLKEINWDDRTLDEKVKVLRIYVGNMDTLTDIHKALLHGEESIAEEVKAQLAGPEAAVEAPPEPAIERMIISYHRGEETATDNLSRTCQAVDRLTGKVVSLRVLKEEYKNKMDVVNLFLHGAKVAGCVDHPNVMPIYSVGVMKTGMPFIVKPFFKGVPLLKLASDLHKTKKKGIDKPRFIHMFSQVFSAVRAAHAGSVLHRRLNPVNVLVGPTGEVYVDGWDFGKIIGEPDMAKNSIKRMVERNALDQSVLTGEKKRCVLSCLPPEIVESRYQEVREASDIYSLGAVLFFLLTGKEPVGGVSSADILQNIVLGKLLVKSASPDEVKTSKPFLDICRKAMSFEPEDRYRSVEAMQDALFEVQ